MKKKGLTLIEIIISTAILLIVVTSIVTIFSSTIRNLDANGKSINNINNSLSELDKAIFDSSYEGNDNNVTQTETNVTVFGTSVPIRYIKSEINDINGHGNSSDTFSYAYCLPKVEVISATQQVGYLDKNKNGIYNSTDVIVRAEELVDYKSTISADFVFTKGSYDFDYDINIDVEGKITMSGVNINSSRDINLKGDEIFIINSNIVTMNRINLHGATKVDIREGCKIISNDEFIVIKTLQAMLSGTNSKKTYLLAEEEVSFDVDAMGSIMLGRRIMPDLTINLKPHIVFRGGDKNGSRDYAWNKNMTKFNYIIGFYPTVEDVTYFKWR